MENRRRYFSLGDVAIMFTLITSVVGFIWFVAAEWKGVNDKLDNSIGKFEEFKGYVLSRFDKMGVEHNKHMEQLKSDK